MKSGPMYTTALRVNVACTVTVGLLLLYELAVIGTSSAEAPMIHKVVFAVLIAQLASAVALSAARRSVR